MDALFTEAFLTSLVLGAVTAGIPLMLAGIGEQISEKAGVLNIGVEGMMLVGAYTDFWPPGSRVPSGWASWPEPPAARRWRRSWRCSACASGSARS